MFSFVFFHLCFPVMMAKEKPPITVVGDVGGRIAIIVVRPQASSYIHTLLAKSLDITFSHYSHCVNNTTHKKLGTLDLE